MMMGITLEMWKGALVDKMYFWPLKGKVNSVEEKT
jgi:hypothetical protein